MDFKFVLSRLLAKSITSLTVLCLFLATTSAFSSPPETRFTEAKPEDGPGSTGGGDYLIFENQLTGQLKRSAKYRFQRLVEKSAERLAKKVESGEIKRLLIETLERKDLLTYTGFYLEWDTIRDLIKRGLVQDIKDTPYEVTKECYDSQGNRKFLSTINGDPEKDPVSAKICIDPIKFYTDYFNGRSVFKLSSDRTEVVNDKYYAEPIWIILGHFLHDHARHFGVPDEKHELAIAFSRTYHTLPKLRFLKSNLYNPYSTLHLEGRFDPISSDPQVIVNSVQTGRCEPIAWHSNPLNFGLFDKETRISTPLRIENSTYSFKFSHNKLLWLYCSNGLDYRSVRVVDRASDYTLAEFYPEPIRMLKPDVNYGFRLQVIRATPTFGGEMNENIELFRDLYKDWFKILEY